MNRRVSVITTLFVSAGIAVACTGTTGQQVGRRPTASTATVATAAPEPDCAESLPPSAQAGQLLMVMVPSATQATDLIRSGSVGGLGLKGDQAANVGRSVAEAIATAPIQPFVASDEEGGTVQRLSAALGRLKSAKQMAQAAPREAAETMAEYATKMKSLGFNMMFGPVADVGSGSGLGTRSFGDDPTVVSSFVTAIVKAVQPTGVVAVVKHWPGMGGGSADPHDRLSALDSIFQLRSRDLIPFVDAFAAGAGAVMVSHMVVPDLTGPDEPASLSRAAITGELRGREHFDGLVITDSLGMGAIVASTPQAEAAERAIIAGADIALISGTDAAAAAHDRLTDAIRSHRIDPSQLVASVRRVLSAKGVSGPCPDLVAAMTRLENDAGTTTGSAPR